MSLRLQTYESPELTLTFDPTKCRHTGICRGGCPRSSISRASDGFTSTRRRSTTSLRKSRDARLARFSSRSIVVSRNSPANCGT